MAIPVNPNLMPVHGCSGCATSGGRAACAVHGRPVQPLPLPVTVTQRRVPVPCEVCKQRGYVPEDVDEPDGDWKQCEACEGKGWLVVSETITVTLK